MNNPVRALIKIENANRFTSMGTLYKLAKVLNCSVDWLIEGILSPR